MTNTFDYIYDNMTKQFPSFELKSKEVFLNLLKTGKYKLKTSEFGYILYFESDFILVDYFAIFQKFQAHGYGSEFLNEFIAEHNYADGCIFEIEKINQSNKNSIRRQRFYEKFGCKKLDFKYYFPNDEKELEMDLLYFPLKNNEPSKDEIFKFIQEYFYIIHKHVESLNNVLGKIYQQNFKG